MTCALAAAQQCARHLCCVRVLYRDDDTPIVRATGKALTEVRQIWMILELGGRQEAVA
jgi:hypothetical protein